MINMTAISELLAPLGITPRIERLDLFGELEGMHGSGDVSKDWPPKPRHSEQTLAVSFDAETGEPIAIFIPHQ